MRASGVADPAAGVPNRPDTRFNAGSVAKTFAGVLTAQLVGAGVLAYDDPVLDRLPELGAAVPAGARVHHLLTHTAGLGDAMLDAFLAAPKHRRVADYLDLCRAFPPLGAPGERFCYSNTGYVVLGALLERVTGRDYYELLSERVFGPARMDDTGFDALDVPSPRRAVGITSCFADEEGGRTFLSLDPALARTDAFLAPVRYGPAGGAHTTAGDLARFAAALRAGALHPARFGEVTAGRVEVPDLPDAHRSRYGYGWFDQEVGGRRIVGHNGRLHGWNAQLDVHESPPWTVVVLANADPPAAQRVAIHLRGLLQPASV